MHTKNLQHIGFQLNQLTLFLSRMTAKQPYSSLATIFDEPHQFKVCAHVNYTYCLILTLQEVEISNIEPFYVTTRTA